MKPVPVGLDELHEVKILFGNDAIIAAYVEDAFIHGGVSVEDFIVFAFKAGDTEIRIAGLLRFEPGHGRWGEIKGAGVSGRIKISVGDEQIQGHYNDRQGWPDMAR